MRTKSSAKVKHSHTSRACIDHCSRETCEAFVDARRARRRARTSTRGRTLRRVHPLGGGATTTASRSRARSRSVRIAVMSSISCRRRSTTRDPFALVGLAVHARRRPATRDPRSSADPRIEASETRSGTRISLFPGSPERIRTAVSALRGRRPRPLDDGARTSDSTTVPVTVEPARGGGIEPPITGPEPVVLPITPPPNGCATSTCGRRRPHAHRGGVKV